MTSRNSRANSSYAGELTARLKALEAELARARRGKGHNSPTNRSKWEFVPASTETGEPWLITYLDLLTLLLVLLIVMLSFAGQNTKDQPEPQGPGLLHGSVALLPDSRPDSLAATEPPFAALPEDDVLDHLKSDTPVPDTLVSDMPEPFLPSPPERSLFDDLNLDELGADIDIIIEEQTVRFRIDSEILFSSGQADLSRPGLAVLQNLMSVVRNTDYIIAVEGHTDSVPIHSIRYPSNWELSGARAGSVVRYLEANGIPSDRLRAIGYADTRPMTDNNTAHGRASNRRVELIMEQAQP